MKASRRQFIRHAGSALLATTLFHGARVQGAAALDDFKMPMGTLGKTGLKSSLLGIGTGTNGWGGRSHQTQLGRKKFVTLLEYAADRGVTYYDLADQYGSHPYMKAALTSGGGSIDRSKVFLLTKTHARTAGEMRADLDRFRKEVGTDFFDVILLHCETSTGWEKSHAGAMDVLSEAKAEGIIKSHGVSCHSIGALRKASTNSWVEVDLARLNPWGQRMDADVETVSDVLRQFRNRQAGIIGMKILGGGTVRSPEGVYQGVEYAMNCGLMDCFTIGISDRAQLDQLLQIIVSVKAT